MDIDPRLSELDDKTGSRRHPKIDHASDLVLFYKKAINGKVLYTKVQDGGIQSFIANDYDRLHQNTAFELFYVLSGSVKKIIEDKTYTYTAGQGCLLNKRIVHSDVIQDGHLLILNISENFLQKLLEGIQENFKTGPLFQFLEKRLHGVDDWKRNYIAFHLLPTVNNRTFDNILDALQLELATSKIGASFLQKGLILRLLSALEDTKTFQLETVNIDLSQEDYLVSRLVSLIESHYGNLKRKDIESKLHYNAEYLNRLLKKKTGLTITAYSKSIRLRQAKLLLRDTSLKISEIANQLEFTSENYFYQYFKELTGYSPNQYRQEKVKKKANSL